MDRRIPLVRLNRDVLDLVEGDLAGSAVVELGGLGRFVVGDLLGVLEGAVVLQIAETHRNSPT